ncbi:hypothetical protein BZA77DRAFT_121893, partial [Pyronema omphalodes]
MEVASLTLGIPGLISLLFITSLEGYRIVSSVRSFKDDFGSLHYQFEVEHQKLKDWWKSIDSTSGASDASISSKLLEMSASDKNRARLIASTLLRIAQLFADVRQMESLYGIRVTVDANATQTTEYLRKRDRLHPGRLIRHFRSGSNVSIAIAVPEVPCTLLSDGEMDLNLDIEKLKLLAPDIRSAVSSYERFKWVFSNKEKLETLIKQLRLYNKNLTDLLIGYLGIAHKSIVNKESKHFMVPFPRNGGFVGVSCTLSWFRQRERSGAVGMGNHAVALVGLGGIGKTQDVLDFAHEYENKRSVYWVHCGSKPHFEEDYRRIATLAELPSSSDASEDIRPVVKRWLENPRSGDWILILDNADDKLDFFPESDTGGAEVAEGLIKHIPRLRTGTAIVVTTRDFEVGYQLANRNVIRKEKMDPVDAVSLFNNHHPSAGPHTAKIDNDILRQLFDELEYLPLAIIQVAVYLEMNRGILTISQYLDNFKSTKESQKKLLSKPVYNSWRSNSHAETVLTTFAITFRQIQTQSPLAASLLKLMGSINRLNIPHDLLKKSGFDGSNDEVDLAEAIGKLHNFSLISMTTPGVADVQTGKAYEIHSLVNLALECYQGVKERAVTAARVASILAEILPADGKFENWKAWRVYYPHAIVLARNLKEDTLDVATMCYKMSCYAEAMGDYPESLSLAQRANALRVRLLGEGTLLSSETMLRVASVLGRINRFTEVEELEVKVLETRRRIVGEGHPDTLRAMSELAGTYYNQRRFKESEELYITAIKEISSILGEDHQDNLNCMLGLASIYWSQHRLAQAEELEVKVLQTRTRVFGEDHPDTLTSMSNLASTYSDQ